MGIYVELSLRSRELINKYLIARGTMRRKSFALSSSMDLMAFISWLDDESSNLKELPKKKQQEIEFILVSLRSELLHDLYSSMDGEDVPTREPEENKSWAGHVKFTLLTVAGILVTACQGFDSISPLLSVLSLPSAAIMGCGFLFSLISVVVFCGFDLVKVSNNLGIKLSDAYKLLDAYLQQLEEIKAIRKKIANYDLAELSTEDLLLIEQLLVMLQKRFSALVESSKQFEAALNSNNMKFAKKLLTGVAGILFFGGGFFAGQTVALFVAGLFISTVSPVFWPVILFGVAVGIAALSIYWFVERPGLQKLVSGWFGLNEENVTKLTDKNALDKEARKLEVLKNKVVSMAKITYKLTQLEQDLSDDSEDEPSPEQEIGHDTESASMPLVGNNIYAFMRPKPAPILTHPQEGETLVQSVIY